MATLYTCPVCKHDYRSSYDLKRHMFNKKKPCSKPVDISSNEIYEDKVNELMCKYCKKEFTSKKGVSQHINKHCHYLPGKVRRAIIQKKKARKTDELAIVPVQPLQPVAVPSTTQDIHQDITQNTYNIDHSNVGIYNIENYKHVTVVNNTYIIGDVSITKDEVKRLNPNFNVLENKNQDIDYICDKFPPIIRPLGRESTKHISLDDIEKIFQLTPLGIFKKMIELIYQEPCNRNVCIDVKRTPNKLFYVHKSDMRVYEEDLDKQIGSVCHNMLVIMSRYGNKMMSSKKINEEQNKAILEYCAMDETDSGFSTLENVYMKYLMIQSQKTSDDFLDIHSIIVSNLNLMLAKEELSVS